MWPQVNKRQNYGEPERENEDTDHHPFIQCAELILPWLTLQELANISFTCKTLSQISKFITLQRSLDASRSLEKNPIPFHNTVDDDHHHPYAYFLYTPCQVLLSQSPSRQPWGFPRFDSLNRFRNGPLCPLAEKWVRQAGEAGKSVCGCDCEGCGQMGRQEGEFLGAEKLDMGIMTECGTNCGCGLECRNRLSQRGISVKLKIVRDRRKGWSLYSDQLIPQGQFVCEYAGEVLTTKEARRRQQIYDERASGGWFSTALLVVREHLPSGKACLRINIDATRTGNVARFINHSCDGGNLSTILVRSSGALLPRLCFFAARDIKEGEELTFSYGEVRVRTKGMQCFCGSSSCFGILPSEHT